MLGFPDVIERMAVALFFGALIGVERQWRARMAGLRTNVLVCLGAASFTVFSMLTPGDASPTRVAAQVVSGIGFLGAGVIMREGLNVRGLNTAATLWCAAAVGVSAGSGYYAAAAATTGFIVVTNVVLRPLVRLIDMQPLTATEIDYDYGIRVVCRAHEEAHVRALLLQGVGVARLRLCRLESRNIEPGDVVEVRAEVRSSAPRESMLEDIVGRLSLEPYVSAVSWSLEDRGD